MHAAMRLPAATLASVLFTTVLAVHSPAVAEPMVVDGVVAWVDGKPITLRALRKRAAPHIVQIQRSQVAKWAQPDAIRAVFGDLLEHLIDETLVEEWAHRARIEISDKEIDDAMDRVAASSKLSREGLLAEALASGMVASDVRAEYRRQLLEWRVLWWTWSQSHDRSVPEGQAGTDTLVAWRKDWLQARRKAACVERRLPTSGR
jgi:hypothetical protein